MDMRRQLGRVAGLLALSMLAIGFTAGTAQAADPQPSRPDPDTVVIPDPGPGNGAGPNTVVIPGGGLHPPAAH
jgi:hypothetical protein